MITNKRKTLAYAPPPLRPLTTLERARQRVAAGVRFTDLTDEELEALANQEPGDNPALTAWIHSLTDEELDAIIYTCRGSQRCQRGLNRSL